MERQPTFGNTELAKKMVSMFGTSQESVVVKMRFEEEVRIFIRKIEEAHQKAAKSKLVFG